MDVAEMTHYDVLKAVRNVLPAPRNYGPTEEEKIEIDRQNSERRAAKKAEADRIKADNDAREFAMCVHTLMFPPPHF